ncbi:alanine racemase [Glycomyces buryatensis]|uniref:Amino acid deaminase n=1 Tax=Glycomyces buryatensis TaxID=2570927 RepID=A0A4S8QQW4_9ACTN|nr:alanine racemase [Glycomyces buryatensis]THV43114.1 amino acid deaminase [Glycomyces buryatensis]
MDETRLQALHDEVLDWRYKSIPAEAHGKTIAEWIATRPIDLETPSVILWDDALRRNVKAMADWCTSRGLALAPHGKATMAPQLWRRQLDAGAVGITVANTFQAGVAHHFGVERIIIANQVTDPLSIARIGTWAAAGTRLAVFVDSLEAADHFDYEVGTPIDVYVELGAPGGRAGARGLAAALDVAAAVRTAPNLRLAGVAGYEGAVAAGTDAAALAAVDAYLADLAKLFAALDFDVDRPVVTAGGSAYFDRVSAILGPLAAEAEVVLRSGSYLVHDHGFYARMTPRARGGDGPELVPALQAEVRVLSRPEPGLAILDGGRRDLPFDQDLPIPLGMEGAVCSQISDQHLFLTGARESLAVWETVELGLSHPCTSFDKWRLLPVVDEETGWVVDAVRTFF